MKLTVKSAVANGEWVVVGFEENVIIKYPIGGSGAGRQPIVMIAGPNSE